jgi:TonB family protein
MYILPVWLILCLPLSGQQHPISPFSERQAVANVQRVAASDLDAALPPRPFGEWLRQVVGAQAGVNWQLNECGEEPSILIAQGRAIPACAEVNALLPDGRKVMVMIEVGSFKKGITGNPSFYQAMVEQDGELYSIRRLRDLPEGLSSNPDGLKEKYAPRVMARSARPNEFLPGENPGRALDEIIGGDVAPPPPVAPSPERQVAREPRKVTERVVRGNAITKVQPIYSAAAKRVQASGTVQVEVTISGEGRVIEATASNGHPLLRAAAIDAARKWVFKPTMLNGTPVKVQSSLTFVFTLTE